MQKLFLFLLLFFYTTLGVAQDNLRVVSLSPIASKALVLLGAQNQVVGCTKWCPFADSIDVVASAVDVNVEQVLRAKPDVVFASTLTSRESIATLNKLGVDVVELPRMVNFESICQELLIIGEKTGCLERSKQEIKKAREALILLQNKIPVGVPPNVMFQVGAKPLFVATQNTFIEDYITQAGGVNVFNDLAHGIVTRESVIQRNPDAIFISTMPTSAQNAKVAWEQFEELSATQKNHVVLIDQELASSPTIHSFVKVVGIMIDVLYN